MSDVDATRVWVLTSLTRQSQHGRRVVISGFDIPMRRGIVAVLAFFAGLVPAFATWQFLGPAALLWIVVAEGVAFVLIESRTRNGLHLRRYRALIDTHRATHDVFYVCAVPIDPHPAQFTVLSRSCVAGAGPVLTSASEDGRIARAYGQHELDVRTRPPTPVPVAVSAVRISSAARPVRKVREKSVSLLGSSG